MSDEIGAQELIEAIQTAHVESNTEFPSGQSDTSGTAIPSGNPYGGIVDIDGTNFDPAIHCFREGTTDPLLTKLGRFRKRKNVGNAVPNSGARPSGNPRINVNLAGADAEDFSSGGEIDYTPQASPERSKLKMAAATAAGLFIVTGISLFGADWQPSPDQSDRIGLEIAFEQYFEAKGIIDIPPGMALTMAMFAYASPRVFKEKSTTLNRLQIFWAWTKFKIQEWRGASRADIGTDRVGENETGKNNRQKSASFWRPRSNS